MVTVRGRDADVTVRNIWFELSDNLAVDVEDGTLTIGGGGVLTSFDGFAADGAQLGTVLRARRATVRASATTILGGSRVSQNGSTGFVPQFLIDGSELTLTGGTYGATNGAIVSRPDLSARDFTGLPSRVVVEEVPGRLEGKAGLPVYLVESRQGVVSGFGTLELRGDIVIADPFGEAPHLMERGGDHRWGAVPRQSRAEPRVLGRVRQLRAHPHAVL